MRLPFKLTSIHRWHLANGATMDQDSGWQRPTTYGDPGRELAACHSGVGICDCSPITKIDVQGQGTEKMVEAAIGTSLPPRLGGITLDALPSRSMAVRLALDQCLILGNSEHRLSLLSRFASAAMPGSCTHVADVTSAYAAIHLVGPLVAPLLKSLSSAPVESIRELTCCQTSIARVWGLLVRLPGRSSPEWLVFVSRDYGEYVWESFLKVGRSFQVQPFGTAVERALGQGASDVATV